MDFPYSVVSFGRDDPSERSPRHDVLLIETFLLRLGGGGNTRGVDSAIRSARNIPARGEFSASLLLTDL
jgi:hypothetical protein